MLLLSSSMLLMFIVVVDVIVATVVAVVVESIETSIGLFGGRGQESDSSLDNGIGGLNRLEHLLVFPVYYVGGKDGKCDIKQKG